MGMSDREGFWGFAKTPAGAAVVAGVATLGLASIFFLLWAGVLKPADLIGAEAKAAAGIPAADLRTLQRSLDRMEVKLASMDAGIKALARFQPQNVRLAMLEDMQAAQEKAMQDAQRRASRDGQP